MFRLFGVIHCLTCLLLAAAVSGCATYRPPPPAFHEVLQKPYALDSGDRLRINVFEQPGLSNSYIVDKGGNINFPLVGTIAARGRTAKDVEDQLKRKLAADYLRDPKVSAEIDQYRPFFIMGEVGTPGQYVYVPGMTVQKAIAIAGGFTPRANQGDADVTRTIDGQVLTGRVEISEPIMPGDTIYVRESFY